MKYVRRVFRQHINETNPNRIQQLYQECFIAIRTINSSTNTLTLLERSNHVLNQWQRLLSGLNIDSKMEDGAILIASMHSDQSQVNRGRYSLLMPDTILTHFGFTNNFLYMSGRDRKISIFKIR